MEEAALRALGRLIRAHRIAALGTLRDGAPFVSMVAYGVGADLGAFWLHLSRLALHTKGILADPRVGLMIAESETAERDPQTLGRVSIQGEAEAIPVESPDFAAGRALYLGRFPDAAASFGLADFGLYRIIPRSGRYVAGFGQIFNVTLRNFTAAGSLP